MMYPGDNDPRGGDQPADTAMKALYRELDQLDLPDDPAFDPEAGFADLTRRLHREHSAAPAPASPVELDQADSARETKLGQLRHEHEIELIRIQARHEIERAQAQAEHEIELAQTRANRDVAFAQVQADREGGFGPAKLGRGGGGISLPAERWDHNRARSAYRAGGLFLVGISAMAAAAMTLIVLAHNPAVDAAVAVIGAAVGIVGVLIHRTSAAAGGALARRIGPDRAETPDSLPRQTAEPSAMTRIKIDRFQGGQLTINDTPADAGSSGPQLGRGRLTAGVLVLALAAAAGGTATGTIGVIVGHLTVYQVILAAAAGAGVVIAAALYKYRSAPQPPPGPPPGYRAISRAGGFGGSGYKKADGDTRGIL